MIGNTHFDGSALPISKQLARLGGMFLSWHLPLDNDTAIDQDTIGHLPSTPPPGYRCSRSFLSSSMIRSIPTYWVIGFRRIRRNAARRFLRSVGTKTST